MEMEMMKPTKATRSSSSPQLISKKLLNLLRVLLMMMRKGISKSKLILDLNLLLKRGNKLANKAVESILTLNHHHSSSSTFSCKSSSDVIISTLKEYEFSFTSNVNSPHNNYHHHRGKHGNINNNDEAATVAAVHRVLEMLNNETTTSGGGSGGGGVIKSPLILPGFGFGKSPVWGRQLRITDSPFPLKEEEGSEESVKVNKAADEFIKKFYRNLKNQTTVRD